MRAENVKPLTSDVLPKTLTSEISGEIGRGEVYGPSVSTVLWQAATGAR